MRHRRGRRPHRRAAVAVLVALCTLLTGCASVVDGIGSFAAAPNANLKVIGDSGGAFDTTVKNALSDVMAFWKQEYPKIADGKPLPPLRGGLYSVDGLEVARTKQVSGPAQVEGCIKQSPTFIIDNGAYCRIDDSIVWDRSPQHLFPELERKYGALVVGLIFAHEFGHAVQERLGIFDNTHLATIYTESQADCAAGAWAATVLAGEAPHFRSTPAQLDAALEGFLNGRDSTPDSPSDISHGDGFDRLSAIADGIDHGATYCYSPNYFERKFTERPFVTDTDNGIIDKQRNGNETLAQVLNPAPQSTNGTGGGGGLQPDLNRFWTSAAKLIKKTWQPVQIAEAAHPKCGASAASEFGYCPANNTVYYSTSFATAAYNSLPDITVDPRTGDVTLLSNQPSDFSLGTLFAVGWGMAVRHQLFDRSIGDKAALLAASCYTGAYAKDINRAQFDSTHTFILSPPDMDEATSAMLTLVGQDRAYGARGTTGLDRIQSFVTGYNGGLSAC